jgi:hypothetical protein
MTSMTYAAAREQIKNGDIISVYSTFSLKEIFPLIVRIFTGSPVYHQAIAIWMTSPSGISRLMCVETHAKGGKRLIPLSYYEGKKFDVTPLPAGADFKLMEPVMMANVGSQPYAFSDLLVIGLHEFFGLPVKSNPDGEVCSELVGEILVAGGLHITDTRVSPGRLKSTLASLGYTPTFSVNM